MDILKEKQWRQIEISKPPGSALIAALLECCSCRTRCHKFHIVVCIHQRLKIYLPVFQILYLVKKDIKLLLALLLAKNLTCQIKQLLQKNIVIYRSLHRHINDILR